MNIRSVKLEMLRHGPAHNQLLSPLTEYLALCGDHPAETVRLQYEHRDFLVLLGTLRYINTMRQSDRETQLRRISEHMRHLFTGVPGLSVDLKRSGKVTGHDGASQNEMIHLRMVFSATELALLPFEVVQAPNGAPGTGDFLALQTHMPICITRETRSSSERRIEWPQVPKILFAASAAGGEIPLQSHLLALNQAIAPWVPYGDEATYFQRAEKFLTVIPEASVRAIADACATDSYTHIHILAHGVPIGEIGNERFGLALEGSTDGKPYAAADAQQLVSAILGHRQGLEGASRPAVVTLSSCDSGNMGSVIAPGASLTHELHAAGIPLVIGSQFPLSFAGSTVMVSTLYGRLLWGEDPRFALHDLRLKLSTLDKKYHDWASLIAYTALPDDIEHQLQETRRVQANAARKVAMQRANKVTQANNNPNAESEFASALKSVERATQYAVGLSLEKDQHAADHMKRRVEVIGLLGSTEKSLASIFNSRKDEIREREALKKARAHYRRAADLDPLNHWVGNQFLAMCVALKNPLDASRWALLYLSCKKDLASSDPQKVLWAHGSMIELYLFTLIEPAILESDLFAPLEDAGLKKGEARSLGNEERAYSHAREMVRLCDIASDELFLTKVHLTRYVDWWTVCDRASTCVNRLLSILNEKLPEKGERKV